MPWRMTSVGSLRSIDTSANGIFAWEPIDPNLPKNVIRQDTADLLSPDDVNELNSSNEGDKMKQVCKPTSMPNT